MQLTSSNLDGCQRVGSKFFNFCRKEGVTQKGGGGGPEKGGGGGVGGGGGGGGAPSMG